MDDEPRRDEHPYFMYDAIRDQPAAFGRVVDANTRACTTLVDACEALDRIVLAGIGTSHHAARIGAYWLDHVPSAPPVRPVHSFDFVQYGPGLGEGDLCVVVSHRGSKSYSVRALRNAHEQGARTALITGQGEPEARSYADWTFHTVPQEESPAHTISYVGALAVFAELARAWGYSGPGGAWSPGDLRERVPQLLREGLEREPVVRQLAGELVRRRSYWIVDGGPGAVTGREIALKIKETSFTPSEGMSIEAMLHGPFQCIERDDLVVLIAPQTRVAERGVVLERMIADVGADCLLACDDEGGEPASLADYVLEIPPARDCWTPLSALIPLQLFAYHLALEHGTNPDGFRLHEDRFKRAFDRVDL